MTFLKSHEKARHIYVTFLPFVIYFLVVESDVRPKFAVQRRKNMDNPNANEANSSEA